jgi:hypothetical protein
MTMGYRHTRAPRRHRQMSDACYRFGGVLFASASVAILLALLLG